MADTKISALPATTTPATSDVTVVVSGGADKQVTVANLVKAAPPQSHVSTHAPAGTDPLPIDQAAGTASVRTLGTGAQQACAGNDSRLSNARTPTAHASTHQVIGGDPISFRTFLTDTSTGTVTTWAPALNGDSLIVWSGSADATFDGLSVATGVVAGTRVTVKNGGSKNAYFPHNSGATSGGKFLNIVTSAPTPVAPGGTISWIWDGSNWQLMAHFQGQAINVPFSAGNFTTDQGTWTMLAGNQAGYSYIIEQNLMLLFWSLQAFSVGGTPTPTQLRVAIPGGFTPVLSLVYPIVVLDNGTTVMTDASIPGALNAYWRCFANPAGSTWQTSANASYTFGNVRFPVN